MIVLVNDLVEFTKKFNLTEKKIDPKIEQQLAELEKEREGISAML